jgi:hypothetical protein
LQWERRSRWTVSTTPVRREPHRPSKKSGYTGNRLIS